MGKHKHMVLTAALVIATTLAVAGLSFAATEAFTKDQAITTALQTHPGKIVKAYKDVERGQEVWEVKIQGDDGKEWELYYDMSGNLVKEDAD